MYYSLSCSLNGDIMLGGDITRVTDSAKGVHGFDRVAVHEFLHPKICAECGSKLDWRDVNPQYLPTQKKFDMSLTCDGYYVVSTKARDIFLQFAADPLVFTEVGDPKFFALCVHYLPIVEVDVESSKTRFLDQCTECGGYSTVLGGILPGEPPTFLPTYIKHGNPGQISRTDLEFGSSFEKRPSLIIDEKLRELLIAAKLRGLRFAQVMTPDSPQDVTNIETRFPVLALSPLQGEEALHAHKMTAQEQELFTAMDEAVAAVDEDAPIENNFEIVTPIGAKYGLDVEQSIAFWVRTTFSMFEP